MKNNIFGLFVGMLLVMLLVIACGHKNNQSGEEQTQSADSLYATVADSAMLIAEDSVAAAQLDEENTSKVSIDDAALRLRQNKRKITGIVVHCSATAEDRYTPIDSVIKSHRYRGFRAIGYHYYITRDGVVHRGRSLAIKGAHVRGHNAKTIGICYEGGLRRASKVPGMHSIKIPEEYKNSKYHVFDAIVGKDTLVATAVYGVPYVAYDTRTRAQKKALSELISHLKAIYPRIIVCGHRDFSRDRNHDGIISPRERLKDCPSFDAMPEYN